MNNKKKIKQTSVARRSKELKLQEHVNRLCSIGASLSANFNRSTPNIGSATKNLTRQYKATLSLIEDDVDEILSFALQGDDLLEAYKAESKQQEEEKDKSNETEEA